MKTFAATFTILLGLIFVSGLMHVLLKFLFNLPFILILRHKLRKRGYEWIGYREASKLKNTIGRNAWRLPPAHEAQRCRQYTEGDVRSLFVIAATCKAQSRPDEVYDRQTLMLFFIGIAFVGILLSCCIWWTIGKSIPAQITFFTAFATMILMLAGLIARTCQICRLMRRRGFEWIDFLDGWALYLCLGNKTRRIPGHEELRLIPCYRDFDVFYIIEMTRRSL